MTKNFGLIVRDYELYEWRTVYQVLFVVVVVVVFVVVVDHPEEPASCK